MARTFLRLPSPRVGTLRIFSAKNNAMRKGTVTLEMALLSPIFFLMLVGFMELCLIEGAQQLLESAAYNASRLAKTGYAANGQTQEQTVRQILTNQLSGYGFLLDPNKVTMTQTVYSNFSQTGSNGTSSTGFGAAQQIVGYRLTYPWSIFTPMMCAAIGSACDITPSGSFLNLMSTIVVRNEPYG